MNRFRHLPRKLLWIVLPSLLLALGYRTLTLERQLANVSAQFMRADTELETRQDLNELAFDQALVALRDGLAHVSTDIFKVDLKVDEVKLVVLDQGALLQEIERRLGDLESRTTDMMLRLLQVDGGLAHLRRDVEANEESNSAELRQIASTVKGINEELVAIRAEEPSGEVLARLSITEERLEQQNMAISAEVERHFSDHFDEQYQEATKNGVIFVATQKPSGRRTN